MTIVIYLLLIFMLFYIGILLWFIAGNIFLKSAPDSLDTPPVSVIIAIRNGEDTLPHLLADLSSQDYSGDMEFIVVDSKAIIGDGTSVWCYAHIREDVNVGKNCNIGNGVYLDKGVKVGNNVSIQNKTLVYRNTIIQDDVFVGPNVVFTNDRNPRSGVIRDLTGISWSIGKGSSIGASSTIMSDINIGKYAMVGANSLVTKDEIGRAHV